MAIIYWSWVNRDKNLTAMIIYAYKLGTYKQSRLHQTILSA